MDFTLRDENPIEYHLQNAKFFLDRSEAGPGDLESIRLQRAQVHATLAHTYIAKQQLDAIKKLVAEEAASDDDCEVEAKPFVSWLSKCEDKHYHQFVAVNWGDHYTAYKVTEGVGSNKALSIPCTSNAGVGATEYAAIANLCKRLDAEREDEDEDEDEEQT